MSAKLVSNVTVVRLPKVSGNVQRVIANAAQKAKAERWRKVLIIGDGGEHGYSILNNSRISYYTLLGMLDYGASCIREELKDGK